MYKNIYVNEPSSIKYDILLSNILLDNGNNALERYINDRDLLIVVSNKVNTLYGEKIKKLFDNVAKVSFLIIETGEHNKNFKNIIKILEAAQKVNLSRNGLLIAIGGGILMDMVGFAVSMYRRKVDYLRIPTTLIGQIDAGIGIKTGINFNNSKNFIGSFYPPIACINDPKFLSTLSKKEIQNGLAEILKMAILCDSVLFDLVENNFNKLISTKFQCSCAMEVNYRAIYEMIRELKPNFYEHSLKRLVDFGHTFSPFIETYSNYRISHGFAVALDIAISTEISFILGKIDLKDKDRILDLFMKIGLKIYDEETFNSNLMWESLEKITAHRGGNLNLPIPTKIGSATFLYDINDISCGILDKAIKSLKNRSLLQEEIPNAC